VLDVSGYRTSRVNKTTTITHTNTLTHTKDTRSHIHREMQRHPQNSPPQLLYPAYLLGVAKVKSRLKTHLFNQTFRSTIHAAKRVCRAPGTSKVMTIWHFPNKVIIRAVPNSRF